jgi:hypothetical protein
MAALVRFIVEQRRLEIGAGEVVQHVELRREQGPASASANARMSAANFPGASYGIT